MYDWKVNDVFDGSGFLTKATNHFGLRGSLLPEFDKSFLLENVARMIYFTSTTIHFVLSKIYCRQHCHRKLLLRARMLVIRGFFFVREESVSQSENESKGSNTSNLYSANRSAHNQPSCQAPQIVSAPTNTRRPSRMTRKASSATSSTKRRRPTLARLERPPAPCARPTGSQSQRPRNSTGLQSPIRQQPTDSARSGAVRRISSLCRLCTIDVSCPRCGQTRCGQCTP